MSLRCTALPFLALALLAPTAAASPAGSDFTIDPNPPNPGEAVTFTFVPAGADVQVKWDITDIAGEPEFERSGEQVKYTYDSPGPKTVRMQVTDNDGTETFPPKTFTVNGPPVVSFDFTPTSPLIGEQVWFDQVVSDPDGDSVTLAWNFGDGGTATGGNPRHTYTTDGTRTVTLKATDEHGLFTTETRELTVRDPAGPTAAFTVAPAVPLVGEAVTFVSTSVPSAGQSLTAVWDLDNDGEFDDNPAGWSFGTPGIHPVSLRVTQTNGNAAATELSVRVNAPPTPGFVWSPLGPVAGQPIDLISLSTDLEGALSAQAWDLDGDGEYDDAVGGTARHTFAVPGTREVGLQVTDSDGVRRTIRQAVNVAAGIVAARGAPVFIAPFPVVRLAGKVLARGALVRLLAVRAPQDTLIRVQCKGRGCPVRVARRTSRGRSVRFRRFERRLRAGVTLEVFVRKPGMVGKYTRFLVRAGAPPKRTDRCLLPGVERPRACP
jgi:PKD repeat protein